MSDTLAAIFIWLIPACPLAAAIGIALFGRYLACRGHRVAVSALAISCALALFQLWHVASHAATAAVATGFEWVSVGDEAPEAMTKPAIAAAPFHIRVDVQIDALTAVMLSAVTLVSFLVAVYASGYMHGDPGYSRFFAELSLFVFSMCMLVMARNFIVLFMFWEAVGLCSYLLIGFWFERPAASAAAVKAFIMNRIGDAAFLVGTFLMWRTFHSLDFADVFQGAAHLPPGNASANVIWTICLCLFIGACGKSAQFPLHLWLPDAMEGPSPVSALIHAATMVTAGVYLVARCTPLFVLAPDAQLVVGAIGGFTALLAALIALTQNDLKRVLAYSTVSQLGYMFLALGSAAAATGLATAAVTAAIFHLFTHAFFKALLFLAAGNVMHAMGDVIDMRRFSGLRKVLPVTHWTFLCGAGALAGFPLLSGFWSKDEIFGLLWGQAHHGAYTESFKLLFWAAFATAVLTAFYTFRAYFLTFHGPVRIPDEAYAHAHGVHAGSSDDHAKGAAHDGNGQRSTGFAGVAVPATHSERPAQAPPEGPPAIHEGPSVMKWPLCVLAVFAVGVGIAVGPTQYFAAWIAQTPTLVRGGAETFLWGLAVASGLAAIGGIAVAAALYARPNRMPEQIAAAISPLYRLSLNKFYLDEIAAALVAFPVNAIAFLSLLFDQGMIDAFVDWIGSIPPVIGRFLRPIQNGLIQSYALVMLFGLGIFLATVIQVWVVRTP